MSTIQTNTLTSLSGESVNVSAIAKALPTAWVNFDGADGTVKDSYNVSSVIRTAVGLYTVNFTTPADNTNYVVSISGDRIGAAASSTLAGYASKTTTSCQIETYNADNVNVDCLDVSVVVHGGKA